MQRDADFITAEFLYMFRASSAHHQEYKILTRQPPVQIVMVAGGSSLRHIRDEVSVLIWRSEELWLQVDPHFAILGTKFRP
jgi:hypothetical protein